MWVKPEALKRYEQERTRPKLMYWPGVEALRLAEGVVIAPRSRALVPHDLVLKALALGCKLVR